MNKYGLLLAGSFIVGSLGLYAVQGSLRDASITEQECNRNYSGCVTEYNCSGVGESVKVVGDDVYGLDRDGDGTGCDRSGGTWESRQAINSVLFGGPAGLMLGWLTLRNKIAAHAIRTKQEAAAARNSYLIAQAKSDGMICPECGGILKRRTGKYGKFIGCGMYPACGYTRKPN